MLRSLRPRAPIERSAVLDAHEWLGAFGALGGDPLVSIDDRLALAVPAFWRATRLRTGVISSLPLVAEIDDRRVGVVPPILAQPDPSEDRQVTVARMAASLTLRGESVAVLGSFDDDGHANALKVVAPDQAQLHDDRTWSIGGRTYSRDEILHVIAFALPGSTRGIGCVELHRRVLAGELAAEDYQRLFYLDGAQPSTVVKINRPGITPTEIEGFKASWMAKLRGRREPVVVPGDMDVTALALSNRDAQFLEGRQFALADIANIVGVPGYFLGAPGAAMTYSNVTDQRRDLLDLYLRDDLYAIERALGSLLPDGVAAKFNPDSFLRLDPKATAETLEIESRWMTIDEIRAVKGLDPLPNGAGKVLAAAYQPPALAPGGQP